MLRGVTCCFSRTRTVSCLSTRYCSSSRSWQYDPSRIENIHYRNWEDRGMFKPQGSGPVYSLVLPPPNITGSLHIGHALTTAIQDALARWRRMSGDRVQWIPGLDHAGIATQVVVERHISLPENGGFTRHELGRERFIDTVHEWKQKYGERINLQMRRLGGSLDWEQEVFTMDSLRSEAVEEAFIRLFDSGMVYRANRIVNWCPHLSTVLSDVEVDHLDIQKSSLYSIPGSTRKVKLGLMYWIDYTVVGTLDTVRVGTTRPETVFGDTALAIHPEDERYVNLHGKRVVNPLTGKELPIILDSILVDPELGTGVVKVTPAHDSSDFECGVRHNLPSIRIFDDKAFLNDQVPKSFQNLNRFDARLRVVNFLEETGMFAGTSEHPMKIGVCSRSGDILEPMVMPQWFIKCKGMADLANSSIISGDLSIQPSFHVDTWNHFMNNCQDWCISRQLWWGHQIPAYKITSRNQTYWIAAKSEKEALEKVILKYDITDYSDLAIERDSDVLDTWFSSGIFPLSVNGWPCKNGELLPISLLETGSDILFFWVARMVMLCTWLNGELPFKKVFLHSMVRDARGVKMSKSLGNVIDPIEVIEGRTLEQLLQRLQASNLSAKELKLAKLNISKDLPNGIERCGADALRMALCSFMDNGAEPINLDLKQVGLYRSFCNKMSQATRFTHMHLPSRSPLDLASIDFNQLDLFDSWILKNLNLLVSQNLFALDRVDLKFCATSLHYFFVRQLCDVYIENCKLALDSEDQDRKFQILGVCLETFLRLLHPIMPFITEDLWQRLRNDNSTSIMLAKFPSADDMTAKLIEHPFPPSIDDDMDVLLSVLSSSRRLIQDFNLGKARLSTTIYINCPNLERSRLIDSHLTILSQTGKFLEAKLNSETIDYTSLKSIKVGSDISVWVNAPDPPSEVRNGGRSLKKKLAKLLREKGILEEQISKDGYQTKVPVIVQEKHRARLEDVLNELSVLTDQNKS